MVSLKYKLIFNRFLTLVEDPTIAKMSEDDLNAYLIEWMHRSLVAPRVRNVFNSVATDDGLQTIYFELKNSIDDVSDAEYIIELLGLGMVISWMQPKIDSAIHLAPFIGGKEEKKLIDNYSGAKERLSRLKIEQKKLIRDRGYLISLGI